MSFIFRIMFRYEESNGLSVYHVRADSYLDLFTNILVHGRPDLPQVNRAVGDYDYNWSENNDFEVNEYLTEMDGSPLKNVLTGYSEKQLASVMQEGVLSERRATMQIDKLSEIEILTTKEID